MEVASLAGAVRQYASFYRERSVAARRSSGSSLQVPVDTSSLDRSVPSARRQASWKGVAMLDLLIRNGIMGAGSVPKGAALLKRGFSKPENKPNFDLNVELNQEYRHQTLRQHPYCF